MSDNPDFYQSPKSTYMRELTKGITNIFPRKNEKVARCIGCQSQPYLELQRDTKGNVTGWCNSCGTNYPLQKNPDAKATGNKYIVKYGVIGGTKSFIVSRKDKRRPRFGELTDDEKNELRSAFGSSGEGVTKIDERESTYDGGSWH